METSQYIDMFLDESREHLQAVNDNLLELERRPADLQLVNEIFRSAHTLKGMAATMDFKDIASLTHQMENVLDKIRNNELNVTTEVIDITFLAIEALEEMVQDISKGNDGKQDVSELVSVLEQMEQGAPISKTAAVKTEVQEALAELKLDEYQQTVILQAKEQGFSAFQIAVTLADDCVLKGVRAYMVVEQLEACGEIIQTVPAAEELEEGEFEKGFSFIYLSKEPKTVIENLVLDVSEVETVEVTAGLYDVAATQPEEGVGTTAEKKEESSLKEGSSTPSKTIRVNLERIDHLMNLFEEMVIDRSRLEDLSERIGNRDLTETVEHMTRVSADMQSLLLTMRMVPVEQVFNRFPRMARSLARDMNKKIDLEIVGADTELDRTVIDEIGDPLVHLIRNSVDHGIESPRERAAAGKPAEGKVVLRAYQSGNHVFIEIEDDGAGINREKVEAKAIRNGLLSSEQVKDMADESIHQLIFSSGFSTAEQVSDISGRGVGLDVVRNKIESLGGDISIESEEGKGSKFSIQLPLTLSILSTLLVDVQRETYAVPLASIVETVLLPPDAMMYVHGQKVMDFRGNIIPLLPLKEVFSVPESSTRESAYTSIVVVSKGGRMTGLVVDDFIGQREVVLKSLGDYLSDVYAISGATILGDGAVSLIIDPNTLVR